MADWPSQLVAKGGIFHPKKVKYSSDTHELLKVLMQESRLSLLQRDKLNYHLRNGEPLPAHEQPSLRKRLTQEDRMLQASIKRGQTAKRRSRSAIEASGAYDMPKFVPHSSSHESRAEAKARLQQLMSGAREAPRRQRNHFRQSIADNRITANRRTELMDEINERAEWLAEIEQLGEGKKYRDMIQWQIAAKLIELKALEGNIVESN